MRIPGGIISILLMTLWLRPAAAQDLSTYVCPSEDEWLELLQLGEISYEEYIRLSEIARDGIDSSSLYLLDEIPNLAYFLDTTAVTVTLLEVEQQSQLVELAAQRSRPRSIGGRFDYRYLQRFDSESKSWYRTTTQLDFSDDLTASWRINRETSGRERIVYRSVRYRNRSGAIRSVNVGNFTARLGLGTLFGYRGKLMSCSDHIDGESLAYPDYGGYNGLYLKARAGGLEMQFLGSITRDTDHRLTSVGGMVKDRGGSLRPGLIFGFNQLADRHTGAEVNLPMIGLNSEYRYAEGYATLEVGGQSINRNLPLAAVLEGRHRLESIEVRYAAWTYEDRFVDLTSGSKAGSVYRDCVLDEVAFECSSKRAGQTGVLLKTSIEPMTNLKAANSLLIARLDRYNHTIQFASALTRIIGAKSSLQLDFLWRHKTDLLKTKVNRYDRGRWRLEGRFNSGGFHARSYIGYNTDSERQSYLSLFATLRVLLKPDGLLEVWSNLNRFGAEGVEYWYSFVRGEQVLTGGLRGNAKIAHTYRNSSDDRHTTTFSLGVVAEI